MATVRTPVDLYALLKARRLELGENQHQFAQRIRKTQAWVSDIERGATPNIYIGSVMEVLALAGLRMDVSLPGKPEPAPVDNDGDLDLDAGFEDDYAGPRR